MLFGSLDTNTPIDKFAILTFANSTVLFSFQPILQMNWHMQKIWKNLALLHFPGKRKQESVRGPSFT